MSIAKIAAVLATGLVSFACLPAHAVTPAPSPMTDAFMGNVTANVAFLERSSRLAADKAGKSGMRSYARTETHEATDAATLLTNVEPSGRSIAVASAAIPGRDGMIEGRSAAVEAQPAAEAAANGRASLGQADLDALAKLSGRSFDKAYWVGQLDALSQIESDYRTYIAHGDDPVLITLAHRELPKVMRRLEMLTKI